jgi:hypothetical protein
MPTVTSKKRKDRFGPYCRALQRGSVGSVIDGRSLQGRFLRRIEGELTAQLGGAPSFAQRLLIRRISRMMLRLDQFDSRLGAGTMTELDQKIYGALCNHVRLGLREIGVKPPEQRSAPGRATTTAATPDTPAQDLSSLSNTQLDNLYALLAEAKGGV